MTEPDVDTVTESPETTAEIPEPQAPPTPPDEDVRTSRALAEIARKERAFRDQVSAFEAERASLMTAKQRAEEYDSLRARLKQDPTEALKLLEQDGHSFQTLVDRVIERDTPEAQLKSLKEEFQSYRRAQEEKLEREQSASRQAAEAQAIADFQAQQKSFIESHEDDYPLIATFGGVKHLYDIVDAHYKETGEVMPHKDAADRLEKVYFDNLSKIKASEKVAKKLGISVAAAAEKASQMTLTAGKTSAAAPASTTTKKIWTAEEAREAALAKVRGQVA